MAINAYPYPNCRGGFELMTKIIQSESPSLPIDKGFTDLFRNFIDSCLQKKVEKRPKYKDLKVFAFKICLTIIN